MSESSKPCIYFALALMSGSSMDGLDIVYCTFQKKHISPDKWDHALIIAQTIPFPSEILQGIQNASTMTAYDFCKFDRLLGTWIGEQAANFIAQNDISRVPYQCNEEIDIVGSHGHTVFHDPVEKMTVQVGHPACIAARIKQSVVADFRSIDVALGGQGAPILPIGDRLLYEKYSFCLNLAGSATITYLDPNQNFCIVAYEVCICNQLLNYLASSVNEQPIDLNGELASTGQIHEVLLEQLLLAMKPKAQIVGYLDQQIVPILEQEEIKDVSTQDKLATAVQAIVTSITNVVFDVQKVVSGVEVLNNSIYMPKLQQLRLETEGLVGEGQPPLTPTEPTVKDSMKVLVSGGGALNKFLFTRLQQGMAELGVTVEVQSQETKYKETMMVGFLAVLRLRKEVNVLSSVTGASQNSVGGCIYIF